MASLDLFRFVRRNILRLNIAIVNKARCNRVMFLIVYSVEKFSLTI